MDEATKKAVPKKACVINIMLPLEANTQAWQLKEQLDEMLKDFQDKRFSFQIVEQ